MVFAKNDIGLVFGNTHFSKCKISFRKKCSFIPKNIGLSKLINPAYALSKGQVIVFCDGVMDKPDAILEQTILPEEVEDNDHEHEEIRLDKEFSGLTALKISDIKEERENKYQSEKIIWIKHNSKNNRLIMAIANDYEADEAYCIERLSRELDGFFIVDHTTVYWKSVYPTETALNFENDIKRQLNGNQSKYGTRIRICILEEHSHQKYQDIEAILIHNYLGKFDVIGIIDKVAVLLYEQQ